jgi:hypothetical protein
MRLEEAILRRSGFHLPSTYLRMSERGLLQYGNSREEWLATYAERARCNPPALLCAYDFEWLSADEMLRWSPPEYWDDAHTLVPFAQSARRDLWCWYVRGPALQGAPVVLAHRDVNEAEVVAPSFEALLYLKLLEACTFITPEDVDESELTLEGKRRELAANASVLQDYLRPEWNSRLRGILARPFSDWVEQLPRTRIRYHSLMPKDELDRVLVADAGVAVSGATFSHMRS